MAKKETKKQSKLDLLTIARTATANPKRSFLDGLEPDVQRQLIQIAVEINSGKITAGVNTIADRLSEAGVPISRSKMITLLAKVKSGVLK